MLLRKLTLAAVGLALGLSAPIAPAFAADDTVGEKVEEAVNDTKRGTKKAARNIKQKGCEMVNGKLECAKDRVKNKAKDVGGELEDAVD